MHMSHDKDQKITTRPQAIVIPQSSCHTSSRDCGCHFSFKNKSWTWTRTQVDHGIIYLLVVWMNDDYKNEYNSGIGNNHDDSIIDSTTESQKQTLMANEKCGRRTRQSRNTVKS
ncbi:hypothetical protein M378DRAFT_182220 [Amanita muscaria Koide BX008]|uniref:Uncharacterized protein n=1 Tax=Amanita muscaria (strain Koide BX008) TaxID=946122 RepID=A0A0C2W344_AMAMK|nr:hypothetical protein M378DRAFT_182220 [Amanita muscaria Koide BX008]